MLISNSTSPNYKNFHFIASASIEELANNLAEKMGNREDPFLPETILITNYALGVWLSHFIAEHKGICANIDFKTPEKYLEEILASDPSLQNSSRYFSQSVLQWQIFKCLKEQKEPSFPYRNKLDEDWIALAGTLAQLFWHYQHARPEMIEDWTKQTNNLHIEESEKFSPEFKHEYTRQKQLWNQLNLNVATPTALTFLDFLRTGKINGTPPKLPPRLFVFAPTALPRTHLALLYKLSNSIEIFFYYHKLSFDLWTETPSKRESLKKWLRNKDRPLPPRLGNTSSENEIETHGNELLSSWGKAAQTLARNFIDLGLFDYSEENSSPKTLLEQIQYSIQANQPNPEFSVDEFSQEPENQNTPRSFCIHQAHTELREIEILRNDIIKLINSGLKPRDILIMLPNVDSYAPAINVVFSESKIPFSFADLSKRESYPGIQTFLSFLKIAQGDIKSSEIVELLEAQSLQEGLKISEEEIQQILKLLKESNMRWGFDAYSRAEAILNPKTAEIEIPNALNKNFEFFDNNSWEFASRRVALTYITGTALSSKTIQSSNLDILQFGEKINALPIASPTGEMATAFSKLNLLIEHLRIVHNAYKNETKTLDDWSLFIREKILKLFRFDPGNEEEALLNTALNELQESAKLAGLDQKINLKTALYPLENRNWQSKRGAGMLRGKVTICSLQPLRNIPAKAIFIAGMGSGKFPRVESKTSLNLIQQWPQKDKFSVWDRSSRDEDCLLLLEALLSAKKFLRFSYIAYKTDGSTKIPACTPLTNLIDYINSGISANENKNIFIQKHRLLNKSLNLDSNSKKNFILAQFPNTSWWESENKFNIEQFRNASWETLAKFYSNPSTFICEKCHSMSNPWSNAIEDNNPELKSTEIKDYVLMKSLSKSIEECLLENSRADADLISLEESFTPIILRKIANGEISCLIPKEEILSTNSQRYDLAEFTLPQKAHTFQPYKPKSWEARVHYYFQLLALHENGEIKPSLLVLTCSKTTKTINLEEIYIDFSNHKEYHSLKYWQDRFLKDLKNPPLLYPDIEIKRKDLENKDEYKISEKLIAGFEKSLTPYNPQDAFLPFYTSKCASLIYPDHPDLDFNSEKIGDTINEIIIPITESINNHSLTRKSKKTKNPLPDENQDTLVVM